MVYTYDNKDVRSGAVVFSRQNKFFDWLLEVLRSAAKAPLNEQYDENDNTEISWYSLLTVEREWLDDVLAQYASTACGCYEVRGFDTTSGNPECISFNVTERFWDDDGHEVTDEEKIANGDWGTVSTEIEF